MSIARFLDGTTSLRLDRADELAKYFGLELTFRNDEQLTNVRPLGRTSVELATVEETLDGLAEFIGYGPVQPSIVFLGTEEAGEPETILARAHLYQPVEDLFDAHKRLESELKSKDVPYLSPFSQEGNPIQQWNTASWFALALARADPSLWQRYWRCCLGRRTHETFLMECFPFPRKRMSHRQAGYRPQQLWVQGRSKLLRDFLHEAQPQYMVAYGRPAGRRCADLFTIRRWEPVPGTPWDVGKAIEGTVVARVGFFGQGQFNREDIEPVVETMFRLGGGPTQITLPG